jgi:xanthine dehydrogenase FAD-binding subunit
MSEVFLPATLAGLFPIMEQNPDAVLLAGGTDLLVRIRASGTRPQAIIGLERIVSLREISMNDGTIRIGAMATHQHLLDSGIIKSCIPVLHQAVSALGSPQIRHMGTIGGNICTASPAGDTLPPLYLLDACLELTSKAGIRTIPISGFIAGPGLNTLQKNEILSAVLIPARVHGTGYYRKVGQRRSLAIAVISMAALVMTDPDGIITGFRFAFGSVGPTVMRFPDLESELVGKRFADEALSEAGKEAARRIMPITDIRASAEYRRMVAETLLLSIREELP